ncbi:MAG TPA: hypothetical protein VKW04_14145 [Planctomycetota bacterium]|nr:hypothetical protein [Planctomycetota bacterium]
MDPEGIVSALAGQVLGARARAIEARAEGKDPRSIESIDRSLRQTLGCLLQRRDLREVALQGFSLLVRASGEVRVRHQNRDLPVSSRSVRSLLRKAGVELAPRQILLLDAVVVERLTEEALREVRRCEAKIRAATSSLTHVSFDAETRVTITQQGDGDVVPQALQSPVVSVPGKPVS